MKERMVSEIWAVVMWSHCPNPSRIRVDSIMSGSSMPTDPGVPCEAAQC